MCYNSTYIGLPQSELRTQSLILVRILNKLVASESNNGVDNGPSPNESHPTTPFEPAKKGGPTETKKKKKKKKKGGARGGGAGKGSNADKRNTCIGTALSDGDDEEGGVREVPLISSRYFLLKVLYVGIFLGTFYHSVNLTILVCVSTSNRIEVSLEACLRTLMKLLEAEDNLGTVGPISAGRSINAVGHTAKASMNSEHYSSSNRNEFDKADNGGANGVWNMAEGDATLTAQVFIKLDVGSMCIHVLNWDAFFTYRL